MKTVAQRRSLVMMRRQRRSLHVCQLGLESLEDRRMMSATPAPEFPAVIRGGAEFRFSPQASQTTQAETRSYGLPNDQFLVGDWNGDRLQDLIVVRPNSEGGLTWLIDLGDDNVPDLEYKYGLAGDIAVLGDWDGNGTDDPGVARRQPGLNTYHWFLNTSRVPYANPTPRPYGLLTRGDLPVVGDWNGDGRDDLGTAYQDRATGYLTWLLDTNGDPFQDLTRNFGLVDQGDVPLVGDWNGDRRDDLAVARPDRVTGEWVWHFDLNGDTVADRVERFGRTTEVPLPVEASVTPSGRDADDRMSEARNLGALAGTRTVADAVSNKYDIDLYRFTVTAGQTVTFDIDTPTNGPPGLGSYLRIFDSQGRELAANNDRLAPGETPGPNSGNDGFDSFIPLQFLTSGTYYAGVSNWQHRSYNPVTGDNALMSDPNWLTGAYSLVISVMGNSVKPTASFSNGVLTVTGTSAADDVTVIDLNGRVSVDVSVNGMVMSIPIRTGATQTLSLATEVVRNLVMNGAAGNDVLRNTSAIPSTIRGGTGMDTIYGGDAIDFLLGEADKDVIYGGDDADTIYGGDGDDSLYGGLGNDLIYGEAGADLLVGMYGDDNLYGGDHNDRLFGGNGLDGLYGGLGRNLLQGEADADRFLYRPGYDTITDPYENDAAIAFKNDSAAWTAANIEAVDLALRILHLRTRSTDLLKLADGSDLVFWRSRSLQSLTGGTVLGRNYDDGNIYFTNAAFAASAPTIWTVVHEIGHNWDEEAPISSEFSNISWVLPGFLNIWKEGTEYVSEYSKRSPLEDFAESFAATMLQQTARIPLKSSLINTWLDSL